MIKKYIAATVGLLVALPLTALAANDVTLTSDVTIPVNGQTYTVSGSSNTLSQIAVDNGTIALTLDNGSSVTVVGVNAATIPDNAASANVSSSSCSGGISTKTYTATSNVVITITPNGGTCTNGSSGSSVTTSNGGGGGGGTALTTTTTTTATPVPETSPTAPAPVAPALQAPVVPAAMNAQPSKVAVAISPVFTRALLKNQKSPDARRLQQLLSLDLGVALKTTGRFDLATQNALKKFQVKYGIAKFGKAGYGLFGPASRAKFAALFEMPAAAPAAPVASAKQQLLTTLLQQISALQAQLKAMQ